MHKDNEIILEFLDHVALRVADIEASAKWYEKVLGLKRYQLPEWGDFPIFLLAGKSGIALFPAKTTDPELQPTSKNVKIDHFAFNVNNENFEKAKKRYAELDLDFNIQDHYFFESIYTKDPDGHTVELTTVKVNEQEFYK
ncbi:VOC family protein [Draconibacterium sediminis]|uniref:VOC family protein n=1 Tax=Draconibacterium sediminis TaxID=1544798 RepID=UPI0026EDDEC9|nr:VOC family protein [Draconibacterium sediminis]